MTMAEIADTLNLNVSTVSRNIARAKKKIFDRIKYYFY
jgi:DNA-directed RNA polymerase specialized sigma24 family protein